MSDESMMETTKYQFPLAQLQKQEFLQEISKPITMTLDPIHNYRRFEASAKP